VTYGQEDQLLKAQKATMQPLASIGHDPANRLAAMDLAQHYGDKLYTGVFYRNPTPGPTFEGLARQRQEAMRGSVTSRADVLNVFRLKQ
jgi:2-oxoglutarate ferredoxin oxidoreductase subunit beta